MNNMRMTHKQREAFALRNYALNKIDNAPFSWCHIRYLSSPQEKDFTNMRQNNSYCRCRIVKPLFELETYGNSFADAYDLFAVNFVNVLLGYIYYPDNNLPSTADVAIKMASSVGTVIGQISFGLLIDIYGRKRVLA
jgi:hypothetical protein